MGKISVGKTHFEEHVCEIRTSPRPRCYLCQSEGRILYQGLRDRLFSAPGDWTLKECQNTDCGLVWLDPIPLPEDIGKAYAHYYTHGMPEKRMQGYLSRVVNGLIRRVLVAMKERHPIASMYLGDLKPGRLLEVGCGEGTFLNKLRQHGWSVDGVDLDSKAVEQAEKTYGICVHAGDLESAGFPEACFDAVVMNHVIEHVFDPVALLRECRRVLKPGGRLVVVTPNIRSWGHGRFGQFWRGLEPPRHIHLFTCSAFSRCAQDADFDKHQVVTTAINASVILRGSLDILQHGKHDMLAGSGAGAVLRSFGFQLWEHAAMIAKPDRGEELVLLCSK